MTSNEMEVDMNKHPMNEEVLNEILIAFLYTSPKREPTDELLKVLAEVTGKTDLVMKEHFKILQNLYRDGNFIELKKLTPHIP